MATTQTKSSGDTKAANSKSNQGKAKARPAGSSEDSSAFFGGSTGAIVGAAFAGAAVGLLAGKARKLVMQAPVFVSGSWDDALKNEHKLTLATFDVLEATGDDATHSRAALVAKLKYALSRHAIEEENVIYPALREAGETADADELNSEHGYVKTYLYELENMAKDSPAFLPKVREFRDLIEEHIREEEDRIFPALKAKLSEEQDRKLTLSMNREGLKLA